MKNVTGLGGAGRLNPNLPTSKASAKEAAQRNPAMQPFAGELQSRGLPSQGRAPRGKLDTLTAVANKAVQVTSLAPLPPQLKIGVTVAVGALNMAQGVRGARADWSAAGKLGKLEIAARVGADVAQTLGPLGRQAEVAGAALHATAGVLGAVQDARMGSTSKLEATVAAGTHIASALMTPEVK